MELLQTLMQEQLQDGGVVVPGGRDPHIELIEVATGRVWMSLDPATPEDYDVLLGELDDSLRGMGVGSASMDAALFQYSPDGEGEPVRERLIAGRQFIHVATSGERSNSPDGMMEVMVHKAHVVGYEIGRTLVILRLPEGDFVEVVGSADHDDQLPLPEGASFKQIELLEPWIVPLPNPTKTIWDFSSGIRSFQGPVVLPARVE